MTKGRMPKKPKKTFIFYNDRKDYVDQMNREEAGIFLKAILSYQNGDPPDLDGGIKFIRGRIKKQLDKDNQKREEEVEKRRNAGIKGNQKRRGKNRKCDEKVASATKTETISQMGEFAKKKSQLIADNDNDNDNVYRESYIRTLSEFEKIIQEKKDLESDEIEIKKCWLWFQKNGERIRDPIATFELRLMRGEEYNHKKLSAIFEELSGEAQQFIKREVNKEMQEKLRKYLEKKKQKISIAGLGIDRIRNIIKQISEEWF